MDNVTLEKLKKTHGTDAEKIFNEIAALGGWGDGREYQDSPGGFDIKGLEDGAAKTKILALLEPKAEGKSKTGGEK